MSHRIPRISRVAAALAGTTLALGLLAACGDDDPDGSGDDKPTATESQATDDDSSGTTESPSDDATPVEPSDPAAIPVYYVGDTPQGDRLFREFVQVAGVEPLVAAAAAVTAGDPVDPDYRTPWPGGRFSSVTSTDDAIVVEVPDEGWLEAGALDSDLAALATQQLAYTLQGVIGERLPIRVEYDGQPADTLLGVDVSGGLKTRPQLDVLALVNITEPAEGSTVSGSITANGRSSSFEATVPWEVQDSTGQVVLEGSVMAEGWLDKLYPWETTIDVSGLEPGSYTFVARTDDPSNGEGGGPTEDTKRITVE